MVEPEQPMADHPFVSDALKCLLERIPYATALSRDGRLLYVNRAYIRLVDFCPERPIDGQLLREITPQWERIVFPQALADRASEGSARCHESCCQRADGSAVHLQVELAPIGFLDGIATIALMTEITGRKNMKPATPESVSEQPNPVAAADPTVLACKLEIEQAALALDGVDSGAITKPEAIVPWLESIAHDFNNLLTLIQVHASTLLAEKGLDKELADSADQIYRAVDRAAILTSKLLTFGQREESE